MSYRTSRNLEASFIDFLKIELESTPYSWENINVVKSFTQVYELELPTICIIAENTAYEPVEIGSNNFTRTVQIIMDIFCANDGQRLDLKDSIIEIIKDGLIYYKYTITKGKNATSSKSQDGRIRIQKITDTAVNLTVDKSNQDPKDRFRHRLTLSVTINKVE